jgi:hypothetical protein
MSQLPSGVPRENEPERDPRRDPKEKAVEALREYYRLGIDEYFALDLKLNRNNGYRLSTPAATSSFCRTRGVGRRTCLVWIWQGSRGAFDSLQAPHRCPTLVSSQGRERVLSVPQLGQANGDCGGPDRVAGERRAKSLVDPSQALIPFTGCSII